MSELNVDEIPSMYADLRDVADWLDAQGERQHWHVVLAARSEIRALRDRLELLEQVARDALALTRQLDACLVRRGKPWGLYGPKRAALRKSLDAAEVRS